MSNELQARAIIKGLPNGLVDIAFLSARLAYDPVELNALLPKIPCMEHVKGSVWCVHKKHYTIGPYSVRGWLLLLRKP